MCDGWKGGACLFIRSCVVYGYIPRTRHGPFRFFPRGVIVALGLSLDVCFTRPSLPPILDPFD